jgi:hypothetical protein
MSAYEFLQVHSHELEPDPEPVEVISEDVVRDGMTGLLTALEK